MTFVGRRGGRVAPYEVGRLRGLRRGALRPGRRTGSRMGRACSGTSRATDHAPSRGRTRSSSTHCISQARRTRRGGSRSPTPWRWWVHVAASRATGGWTTTCEGPARCAPVAGRTRNASSDSRAGARRLDLHHRRTRARGAVATLRVRGPDRRDGLVRAAQRHRLLIGLEERGTSRWRTSDRWGGHTTTSLRSTDPRRRADALSPPRVRQQSAGRSSCQEYVLDSSLTDGGPVGSLRWAERICRGDPARPSARPRSFGAHRGAMDPHARHPRRIRTDGTPIRRVQGHAAPAPPGRGAVGSAERAHVRPVSRPARGAHADASSTSRSGPERLT
jgi:hypothetical protein